MQIDCKTIDKDMIDHDKTYPLFFYLKLCTRQVASFITCVSQDVNCFIIETMPLPDSAC